MKQTLPALDKSTLSVTRLGDTEEEKAYWLSRTPEERLAAIEVSRRMVYGEDANTVRLVKVFEFCKLARRKVFARGWICG
jgi:hypothetical protein